MAAAATRTLLLPRPKLLEPSGLLRRRPRHLLRRASFSSQPLEVEAPENPVSRPRFPNVVDVLRERGLLDSLTNDALRAASSNPASSPLRAYCGFDPTAESLHLGNLLGLVVLSWFQRCGHRAIALVGGATARIGDPSGKSLERPELDLQTIERNTRGIEALITKILGRATNRLDSRLGTKIKVNSTLDSQKSPILSSGFEENEKIDDNSNMGIEKNSKSHANSMKKSILSMKGSSLDANMDGSFVILNNYDWWKDMTLLDFLKEVGRFARVGAMMAKESVKKRLMSEEGMSYTEFTYQLLQGYDFVYMFKNMGVNVQIGGSDQWGNITAGTELIRKILQVEGAYGLTFPLLLKSDGTKFGKSEGGAIWLSSTMLSPYKFYQYFFSVPDVDVVRFLKILTFLSMEEIGELEEEMKRPGYVPNSAQRRLAEEVTLFVHGEDGLAEALKVTEALRPGAETRLDWQTIEGMAEDVPSCSLAYDLVLNSFLVDLSVSSGLLASKSAARRMVKQGGLYLNNRRVDSEDKVIEADDIVDGKILLLSAGKKNKMVIRIS